MGIRLFGNSSCGQPMAMVPSRALNNPDPTNYRIERVKSVGPWLVAEVVYPDATNYEGRKVMLYRASEALLRKQKRLDPHFCDHAGHLSPFARFEPTERGWEAALALANLLGEHELCASPDERHSVWDRLKEDDG